MGKLKHCLLAIFSNRQIKIRIQNVTSDNNTVTTGRYVNNLLKDMPENSILSYADHTIVCVRDHTWQSVCDKMIEIPDYVESWLVLNNLSEYKQNRIHNGWKLQR